MVKVSSTRNSSKPCLSEKLSQLGMLRTWNNLGVVFSIAMIRHDTFCPWFTSQLWNFCFFLWQIGVRASFGECPFHTIPTPIPFSSTVHVHSWGRMSCYYQGPTQMNSTSSLLVNACSFHGLFWDTPGVPKRLRNRCLSSSPWVALVPTLRKLASACRSHWSLLLHLELFQFFLDEGPMIQNWVCRGPSNRRGGWGACFQKVFVVHPKWTRFVEIEGFLLKKWPRSIL